mmetsp:Transcript_26725/g.82050  ORF Transcript_26725/g.82050 Transcript_26725/m.82050 type:complete len:138 (+) Transcript_26725:378-791(+)
MALHCTKKGCVLCDTALPEESWLLGEETSGRRGGCLRSDGVVDHTSVEVLSTANGAVTGYSFFRRCPKCGLIHYHGHAVMKEKTPTTAKQQILAYYLYPDFDSVGRYFSISSQRVIATRDLLQYQVLNNGLLKLKCN